MNDSMHIDLDDQGRLTQNADVARPRAVGSPLPVGTAGRGQLPQGQRDASRLAAVPPPGRALVSPAAPAEQPSSLQRAVNALCQALPFVQRLLPLLDSNVTSAVSSMLAPRPLSTAPPPPPVSLAPIENGLAELRTQQCDLRDQVVEQNASLKRVEDQLEMVREATDRNTLEQQELLEDLKTVSNKVNAVALVAMALLLVAILLNVVLYLHIQRVLP